MASMSAQFHQCIVRGLTNPPHSRCAAHRPQTHGLLWYNPAKARRLLMCPQHTDVATDLFVPFIKQILVFQGQNPWNALYTLSITEFMLVYKSLYGMNVIWDFKHKQPQKSAIGCLALVIAGNHFNLVAIYRTLIDV